ncbi:MAG: hypothetical protein ACOC5R_06230 [Elusimicrobiota bacterium]
MRKLIIMVLPYGILCLITLILAIIWWPIKDGGWVQLTNSWIALFFVCAFCAIFLFQEDIDHFFENHIKDIPFISSGLLQKDQALPEILKDEKRFEELISGTVMAWMERVNIEKEEKRLREKEESILQLIEQFKKAKKENIKWLFLFADYFLVQHSKDILYEIYERHYLTEQAFREITKEIVINEKESGAILQILSHLRFIKRQEAEIIITETGSAYCAYLEQTVQK